MDQPPTPPQRSNNSDDESWPFGFKVAGLITLIVLLFGGWLFFTRIGAYYQQIQTGSVDVSAFSNALVSAVSAEDVAASPTLSRITNFDDDPQLGSADAPLTIVLFEDFECPFCGDSYPAIKTAMQRYAPTGQVRFVYRDFPLSNIHPNAQHAAEAGQCALEQGAFWEYHDMLFQRQSALAITDLKRYAGELRLDQTQFDSCLDTGKYTSEVEADYADGLAAGVLGTPTLFFNGQPVSGVLTEEGIEQLISVFINPN